MIRSALSIVVMLFAVSSYSQSKTSLGITTGLSISDQWLEYRDGSTRPRNTVSGFVFGIAVEAIQKKYFSLHNEFTYIEKGSSVTYPDGEKELNRANYVFLASSARLKYPIGSYTPFLTVGPRFEIFRSDGVYRSDERIPVANFGANFGLGLDYRFKERYRVGVQGIYLLDFHAINPYSDYGEDVISPDIWNRALAVTVHFMFDI